MMFFLIGNILPYFFQHRCTYGERAIPILPFELLIADGFMNPGGRNSFYVAHYVRQSLSRAKSNQQMNVVGYAANGFGNSLQRAQCTADVSVKTRTPFRGDEGALMFCAEDDVAMKT